MKALYSRVPVFDCGARAATLSFVRRRIGDVLLAWENEAYLAQTEFGENAFDIVYPPASILAEPPVALVDKNVDKRGTRAVAEAYLQFLYSKTAQEIEAKNHYRPRDPEIAARYASTFPTIKLYTSRPRSGRLASDPEDPFRRRRDLRSDRGQMTSRHDEHCGALRAIASSPECPSRLQAGARLHAVLPFRDRAFAACGPRAAAVGARAFGRHRRSSPIRASFRRCASRSGSPRSPRSSIACSA